MSVSSSDEDRSEFADGSSEPAEEEQTRANAQIRNQVAAAREWSCDHDICPPDDNDPGRCIICYDLSRLPMIWCQARAHKICGICAPLYVTQQLESIQNSSDKFNELVLNQGAITCPAPECTDVYEPRDLLTMLNEVQWRELLIWMNKAQTAKAHQDNGATVLSALFPTAIMCRLCLYGPVDFKSCDDLKAHHGRRSYGALGRTSNACPRCNWFSSSRRAWLTWDGVVRMSPLLSLPLRTEVYEPREIERGILPPNSWASTPFYPRQWINRPPSRPPVMDGNTVHPQTFRCAWCNSGPFRWDQRILSCPDCRWAGWGTAEGPPGASPTGFSRGSVEPPKWGVPTYSDTQEEERVRGLWRIFCTVHEDRTGMDEVD